MKLIYNRINYITFAINVKNCNLQRYNSIMNKIELNIFYFIFKYEFSVKVLLERNKFLFVFY